MEAGHGSGLDLLTEVFEPNVIYCLDIVAVELVEHLLHLKDHPRNGAGFFPSHLDRTAHV